MLWITARQAVGKAKAHHLFVRAEARALLVFVLCRNVVVGFQTFWVGLFRLMTLFAQTSWEEWDELERRNVDWCFGMGWGGGGGVVQKKTFRRAPCGCCRTCHITSSLIHILFFCMYILTWGLASACARASNRAFQTSSHTEDEKMKKKNAFFLPPGFQPRVSPSSPLLFPTVLRSRERRGLGLSVSVRLSATSFVSMCVSESKAERNFEMNEKPGVFPDTKAASFLDLYAHLPKIGPEFLFFSFPFQFLLSCEGIMSRDHARMGIFLKIYVHHIPPRGQLTLLLSTTPRFFSSKLFSRNTN